MAEATIYADLPALIAGAADFIATLAREALATRGRFTIALSGGNTPKPVYERLASISLDWARVHVVFGDERCVPPDDPRSNYHMAKAALLDRVRSRQATFFACAARTLLKRPLRAMKKTCDAISARTGG